MMFQSVVLYIIFLFFSLYKFIIHLITRKCSILRIVLSSYSYGRKYVLIENNIKDSKQLKEIKFFDLLSENEVNDNILKIAREKRIEDKYQEQFSHCLFKMVKIVRCYRSMVEDISSLKNEKVDINNKYHKDLLLSLWKNINPNEALDEDMISKKWTDIGFQGKNPQTDFRGMGLLGLVQIVYLSQHDKKFVDTVLSLSNNFTKGYPMAVAGINLTGMLYQLLIDNKLKLFFYSFSEDDIDLLAFHRLYVTIFKMFHQHWLKHDPGVMQFNVEKEKFCEILSTEMNDETQIFKFI